MRFLCLAIAILCPASLSAAPPLQAGVAVVDITPPVPYRMSGYFSERLSTGTKDPLHAKAVVFSQGETSAALVFCDVVGISLDVSDKARTQAARVTGIPASNIAICATHSHTGPLYFGALRKLFHEKTVREKGKDPLETVDYPAQLVERIVTAVERAKANAGPIVLDAGSGQEDRLSFNRRFHMKGGGPVRFNPGQLNPNILRVAGPIDPEVGIVRLSHPGGERPLAAIIAFALHLDTVGGTEYSADYPRHLEDDLRARYGKDFVALFGAGTCGDINHVDVTVKGRRKADEIGKLLGESVAAAFSKLKRVEEPSLAARRTLVEAKLQGYSDAEVDAALERMPLAASRSVPFLERVKNYKIAALELREGLTIPCEVQAFRLSKDVAVVTLPGEVFVELGLAIKKASPFPTTLVIELTNDAPGYLPTKKAFTEGSYETVNSRVQPGEPERMVAAAVKLLKELAVEK
jgi:hypothetical protein